MKNIAYKMRGIIVISTAIAISGCTHTENITNTSSSSGILDEINDTYGFPTAENGEWTYHKLNYYELGELEGKITRFGELKGYIQSNMAYPYFFALDVGDSYRIVGAQLDGTDSNIVNKDIFDSNVNLKLENESTVYSVDLKGLSATQAYTVGETIKDDTGTIIGIRLNKKIK